jgi:hypothetical protein
MFRRRKPVGQPKYRLEVAVRRDVNYLQMRNWKATPKKRGG